ncbi:MAG: histidine kinase, partial [Betaproteobacteria bacterium]|nr:histidine kinase [Betaproteobacteria bacterium]
LAIWLRQAIKADVKPLADLERSLNIRDERDLEPIPVAGPTQELERLTRAINDLLGRISGIVQSQREFAGNVAHELRTPLAGIRALAEYGLAQDNPAIWRGQLLVVLEREQYASHIIDQLLALALVVEAQEVFRLQPLRLDLSLREALLRHLRRADALGVDLGVRGADNPIEVIGQSSLIDGILDNLIDNSLRYGKPPDGSIPTITMGIDPIPEGGVVLSVVDNGPGISRLDWERLTVRWAKGPSAISLRNGTGLGLYLVAEYCRILRAELHLDTSESARTGLGQGAQIKLRFTS